MKPVCPIHGIPCATAYRRRRCRCSDCRRTNSEAYAAWARKNAERVREANARYYAENRERQIERSAEWAKNNRERSRQIKARYEAANRENVRARLAQYRAQNPEKLREKNQKYRAENPEKIAALNQRYVAEGKKREWSAEYRERHPEQARASTNKWRTSNPEKHAAKERRRRARTRGVDGSHTADDIVAIYQRQKGRCLNCTGDLSESGYHVDHIEPLVRGGSNGPENLQLLCPPCNLSKGAKCPIEWAQENGRLL